MYRRIALPLLAALFLAPLVARGAEPAPAPTPASLSTTERTFVTNASATLKRRFPTPAAAEKAGYFRYTNEDDTGAISYANLHWDSADEAHPSQIWYDVKGRLLGADYSQTVAAHATPSALFGIAPSRFSEFGAHVHYVLKNADGSFTYGRAIGAKKYAAAGADPKYPTAAGLVKAGVVPSAGAVSKVFLFPHLWDVSMWVLPNPNGPFADTNPNVKPSHPPGASDMQ